MIAPTSISGSSITIKRVKKICLMAEVEQAVLFVSSASKFCQEPLRYAKGSQLPIDIVRLDTKKARERAQRGKYVQINVVPSLMVIFTDGNLQLFTGSEKIVKWIKQAVEFTSQPPPQETQIGTPKQKQYPVKFDDTDSESEEDDSAVLLNDPKTIQGDLTMSNSLSSALSTNSNNAKNSKMKSVAEMAKELEKQRTASLGYREEELPKN